MPLNTLAFLLTSIKYLEAHCLPIWVFGGWAEELWQVTETRPHHDIDFLYFAATFEKLDQCIAQMECAREIQAKHFSHKRAVLHQGVMMEFLLVQGANGMYSTDFFSGLYHLQWPADIFCYNVKRDGYNIPVASRQALGLYRQHHERIQQAYQEFQQFAGR